MVFFKRREATRRNRQQDGRQTGAAKAGGELLVANNHEISGWAFGPASDEPALVTIIINGIEAVQVRANLRKEIRLSADGQRRPCGFKLAIHQTLRDKLPPTNIIEARLSDGAALPSVNNYLCELTGTNGVSAQELSDAFASGSILIPKSGLLLRPIAARKGWAPIALQSYQEAEHALQAHLGKNLFVAYGTLLGLIRENQLLGHDDDVDAMFLLDSTNAKAAGREFADIAQKLSTAGEKITKVFPGGNLHWQASSGIVLDVFGCWADKDTLNGYMFSFPGSKSDVLPTTRRELHNIDVAIPAAPERFLEGIYGHDWRIPDPQFQWQPSQEIMNRMTEFGSGVRGN